MPPADDAVLLRAARSPRGPLPFSPSDLFSSGRTVVVLLPLHRYEADLGMPTRRSLARQLAVDVPRCVATVDGARVRDGADPAWARVAHARLCTQAVLAPPVEWLCRAGAVARECGAPLEVRATTGRAPEVEAHKTLALARADDPAAAPIGAVHVRVHADGARDLASVELRCDHGSQSVSAYATASSR
jgi:hypothetical protein